MLKTIIDTEAALRLKGFSFIVPSRVKGQKAGIHKSYYKGSSPNFMEYKEYNSGEDIKQIDWRLYGRLDRLYVRNYEDEVNLIWNLLVDTTASMGYGEEGNTKLDYAKTLAGTLTYLLLKQGDAVGIMDIGSNDSHFISPRAGMGHINPIVDKLEITRASGSTDLYKSVLKSLEVFRANSAIVIFSDLLTEITELENSFNLLKASKKDVFIFHILHRDEIEFEFNGALEFHDMEDHRKLIVDTESIRNTYKSKIMNFVNEIKELCYQSGFTYVLTSPHRPVEDSLIEIAYK